MLVGLALMKKVERTNVVVVRNLLQEQEEKRGGMRRDPYTMNVYRKRSCYNCGGFGYIAKHCKSWGIVGQERRIEYRIMRKI